MTRSITLHLLRWLRSWTGFTRNKSSEETVDCGEVVVRIFRNAKHRDASGGATADAFVLRSTDEGRLSVFRLKLISVQDSKTSLRRTHGAATLHTGRVRSLVVANLAALDILPAEGEGTDLPGHAAIVNLPDPEVDPKNAERFASLLRDISRPA